MPHSLALTSLGLGEIGWRLDNFWQAARLLALPMLAAVVLIVGFGLMRGSLRFVGRQMLEWALWLPLWGLMQQYVLQGFVNRRIPLFLRRLVTMVPALIVIAAGADPSRALVISQVVLSFGIPFALIPLLLFCRNREIMGALVNRRVTTAVATVVALAIICLNVFLLQQTLLA